MDTYRRALMGPRMLRRGGTPSPPLPAPNAPNAPVRRPPSRDGAIARMGKLALGVITALLRGASTFASLHGRNGIRSCFAPDRCAILHGVTPP
jgi:hypothetical protein